MARRARIHRRVEVDVWQSRDFRGLSAPKPNAQTLWLWLLTSERTTIVPGLVLSRPAVMADDLRWPLRGFNAALDELEAAGMVEVDREAGVVLLTRALLVDGKVRDGASPTSINAAKSWATTLLKLPPSPLRDVVRDRASIVISHCEAKIRSAFAETMSTPCARQADADCTASALREQRTDNRDQEDTHTGAPVVEASDPVAGSYDPQAPADRSRDRVMATAAQLYDRHAAYLRKLAASIPGCPEPVVGGLAPARTLTAIAEVVAQWHSQAAELERDPDAYVEAQMVRLVAVRSAKARVAGHVRWWASDTFWGPGGIERDLLQSPEQAADGVRPTDSRPRPPRPASADARVTAQLERVARLRALEEGP